MVSGKVFIADNERKYTVNCRLLIATTEGNFTAHAQISNQQQNGRNTGLIKVSYPGTSFPVLKPLGRGERRAYNMQLDRRGGARPMPDTLTTNSPIIAAYRAMTPGRPCSPGGPRCSPRHHP